MHKTERWFDAQLLTLSYREAPQRHMHFKETSFLKVDALTAFWYKLSTPDDFFEPPIQSWQVLLTCFCIMNDVGERLLYTVVFAQYSPVMAFYPRDAMRALVFARAMCPSVCLSHAGIVVAPRF